VFDVSIPMHAGYTFRSRAILEQQRALGWKTFHVTSSKQVFKGTWKAVESAESFEFNRTRPGRLHDVPVLRQYDVIRQLKPRIKQVALEQKVDLMHAHSPCLVGLATMSVAKELGIPFVYECRAFWEDASVDTGKIVENGMQYKFIRALETKVFKGADEVICISKGLYDDILERGVSKSKVTIVGNAANLEQFKVLGDKDPLLLKTLGLEGKAVLGFFGSFYFYEGIDQVIAALPLIKQSIPNIHLLLLGGGNEENALKAQAQTLGVSDCVSFIGRVPQSEIPVHSSLVDAFIFPRRSIRLTNTVTPLKPLEAMAQGRLVIASDVGGHKELIDDNKTGYLYPAESEQGLVDAVIRTLKAGAANQGVRDNALAFVQSERSWRAVAKRYESVYQRLVDKGNRNSQNAAA
jgi:PEP-CTERM/exosortase A-associated glycosyltransferase